MERMRMYRTLYWKELRFLFLPAVTLVAVLTCFMLFRVALTTFKHYYGWRVLFEFIQLVPVIEHALRYLEAFLPAFLYIPAVLLGWSLISERLAKTRLTLVSLPVRRNAPALMKCAAAVTLGFVIAFPVSRLMISRVYLPGHIVQSIGPVETFLHVLRISVIRAISPLALLRPAQITALMSCFIGMVFLADSIAETIGRFRVAIWTFTLIGCTALFIVVLDTVYPDRPVYIMFARRYHMYRAIRAAWPGLAVGAVFVAVGAFLSRYHET